MRDEDIPPAPAPDDLDELADEGPWYRGLPGLQFLEDIEPLTRTEAKSAREKVARSIKKWGELADELMPLASRTGADVAIWSTLDEGECQVLADWLIDLGKERAVAAQVVRGLMRTYYLWEVGAITIPRLKATISYYVRNGIGLSLGFRPQPMADALSRVA